MKSSVDGILLCQISTPPEACDEPFGRELRAERLSRVGGE
jgi:hypothetical protein